MSSIKDTSILEKLNEELDKRIEENYGEGADWDLYAKGAYYAYKNIQMSLVSLKKTPYSSTEDNHILCDGELLTII